MNLQDIIKDFLVDIKDTTWIEYIAVFSGIASVWYSRKESILTYPVGLLNTTFYIYLSVKYHLPGEASVNLYYTIMSLFGWYNWARKNEAHNLIVHITRSGKRDWLEQIVFFLFFYIAIYFALVYLKENFFEGAIPWADAFASSTAFTGMWLMTRKKVESWYWWIATNIASIPLYFVKHLAFTSLYYFILLIFAFWGLAAWRKKAEERSRKSKEISR